VVFPYVGRKFYIHISASSHTQVHNSKYVYEYLIRPRMKKRNFLQTRAPLSRMLVIKMMARLCNKHCNFLSTICTCK